MKRHLKRLIIRESQRQHIWQAHQVRPREVYEAIFQDPESRFYRMPDPQPDGRLYQVFGQTSDGRLLKVLLRIFSDGTGYVITAMDMTAREVRTRYRR